MRSTRGAALLTAATMAMTAVAGCGEEGGPTESTTTASPRDKSSNSSTESPTGSSSTSPGTSESSSGTATAQLPEAATKKTKAGAIAFNEFYWTQRGEALKTGDTTTIRVYSATDCTPCNTYAKTTDENRQRGVKMNKNPNSIREVRGSARSDRGFKITVTIDASEYHEVMPDGQQGRTAEAVSFEVVTDTRWQDGHWVIQDSVITETQAPSTAKSD